MCIFCFQQVSFDLGCIYFQQQNYVKADNMFRICKEEFSKVRIVNRLNAVFGKSDGRYWSNNRVEQCQAW